MLFYLRWHFKRRHKNRMVTPYIILKFKFHRNIRIFNWFYSLTSLLELVEEQARVPKLKSHPLFRFCSSSSSSFPFSCSPSSVFSFLFRDSSAFHLFWRFLTCLHIWGKLLGFPGPKSFENLRTCKTEISQ